MSEQTPNRPHLDNTQYYLEQAMQGVEAEEKYRDYLEAENRRLTVELEEERRASKSLANEVTQMEGDLDAARHDLSAAQTERDEAQKLRIVDAPEPAEDSPKELTVEDLDAAPVGSVLSARNGLLAWTKLPEGVWGSNSLLFRLRSSFQFAGNLEGYTLTPPEKPELPTEPGSVILATEWKGEKLDRPIYAVRTHFAWRNISARAFPDGSRSASPSAITGWKPARIVVEDGE